jgi:predicted nucleotidyltransferase
MGLKPLKAPNMADANLELLSGMALAMGPLCEQVVFVGGCATGLLITQPMVANTRATEDVDAIVEVASLVAYHALAAQLMERGFKQTMANNTPPFRWFWQSMQLDLVPLDEKVLGFANRWYRPGFETARLAALPSGLRVRHLSSPYFVATKLEAFNDRGNNDVYFSHDLEDIVTVVDGRAELLAEVVAAPADVRSFIATQFQGIVRHPDFFNALPGIVAQGSRSGLVMQRWAAIANIPSSVINSKEPS